ncbi:hypothetical protein BGX38DRAFT_1265003 [Terfezia claveryi]|nr:hypothetical protein BGX38DRAFT_1265003 [Terfezia claveryi]
MTATTPIPKFTFDVFPPPTCIPCSVATTVTFAPTHFLPTFSLDCSDLIIPATTISIIQTPETSHVISIPVITSETPHPTSFYPTRTYNLPYHPTSYPAKVEQDLDKEFTLTLLRSSLEFTLLDLTQRFARACNITLGAAWETIGGTLRDVEEVVEAAVHAEEEKLETGGQTSVSTEDCTSLTISSGTISTGPDLAVMTSDTEFSEVVIPTTDLKPEVTLTVNGAMMR